MSGHMADLWAVERILLALDASGENRAAIEAAAALAARLHAELEALFVEDADLLRLADLPCARVTSMLLLAEQPTDRERMERQLRLRAAHAEEMLQRRATALGVRASFRQVRGEVSAEIRAAAEEADLVSLGSAGYTQIGWPQLGLDLKAALSSERPLLIPGRWVGAGAGLLMVHDGSPADARALAMAAGLAARSGLALHVLALAPTSHRLERLLAEVRAQVADWELEASLRGSTSEARVAVPTAARRLRPAMVILGIEADDEQGQQRLQRLLRVLECSLLVVPNRADP